jgi:hypothetical protein
MQSIDEVIKKTVDCSLKNERIAEIDQHRFRCE